jgi:hypothetical protein
VEHVADDGDPVTVRADVEPLIDTSVIVDAMVMPRKLLPQIPFEKMALGPDPMKMPLPPFAPAEQNATMLSAAIRRIPSSWSLEFELLYALVCSTLTPPRSLPP